MSTSKKVAKKVVVDIQEGKKIVDFFKNSIKERKLENSLEVNIVYSSPDHGCYIGIEPVGRDYLNSQEIELVSEMERFAEENGYYYYNLNNGYGGLIHITTTVYCTFNEWEELKKRASE